MFTSLRTRLWFTYALLIGGVLFIVGAVFFIFLIRNPPAARQAYLRLNLIADLIQRSEPALENATKDQITSALIRADQRLEARFAIFGPDGKLLVDSRAGSATAIPVQRISLNQAPLNPNLQYRDALGRYWLYTLRSLANGDVMLVSTIRPSTSLAQIRDDLRPLIQAGILALFLALFLGFWIARWISAPLQRMANEAHTIATGQYHPIPLEGPIEVKNLAGAINEMADKVQTSQKSQRDFVANVSHELKTPLTSIQGFAQAILDGTANTPESLRQAGQVIYSEADRMHRMVLDLLDLARLDAGTAEIVHSPLDIANLLSGVVDKMTPQARQAQVNLQADINTLPDFIGDGDRLAQVFTNLVDNAIKYTPSGGKVQLKASQVDGQVEISVSDTGSGIPPDELSHIFERFYQTDKSRRGGSGHGVGLGLAIAREIVLAHHGTITARSDPGQGSTFTVLLPVAHPDDSTLVKKGKNN